MSAGVPRAGISDRIELLRRAYGNEAPSVARARVESFGAAGLGDLAAEWEEIAAQIEEQSPPETGT